MIVKNFFKNVRNLVLAGFVLSVAALSAAAQTVLVNYNFASAVAGTPCTSPPATTATGVTSTFTAGGTGGGTCTRPGGTASTAPPAFVANASDPSVSLTGFAAGSSNYFQFQLSGVNNYRDYQLFFQTQRSGTGPVNVDVQYSTDGTTFTTFQTVNPGNGSFIAYNIDLSSVSAIEDQPTVYFRLVGTNGTAAAGTYRIDNFQVQASLPPTASTVSITGRVNLPGNSTSLRAPAATVTLTDPSGATQSVRIGIKGHFRFRDVLAGQQYILTVSARGYTFAPQVVTATEDVTDLSFTPNE